MCLACARFLSIFCFLAVLSLGVVLATLVPREGLEPSRLAATGFESVVSAIPPPGLVCQVSLAGMFLLYRMVECVVNFWLQCFLMLR